LWPNGTNGKARLERGLKILDVEPGEHSFGLRQILQSGNDAVPALAQTLHKRQ
jgi:hypothetical protein